MPGLKPFSEFAIGFTPVRSTAGLSTGLPISVPISNPPDLAILACVDNPIVLSCFFGLGILHLLSEGRAKWLEIRFEKPDVPTHHAEMGNLLSFDPKIHSLRTHAKIL